MQSEGEDRAAAPGRPDLDQSHQDIGQILARGHLGGERLVRGGLLPRRIRPR
ncbi:hypothetical protein [Streptomyces sp. NRRL S-340]|uniref:hypothetical protein n=1 Tax=Streptomyces sp. NRRL S-340 TaxID=1463901 RepID=UPI00131EC1EB|nr:hypothetical protein [Streptomyces sp. NRRL S-340]